MSSFNDLKRSSTTSFEQLNKELAKLNTASGDNRADDRLWAPARDKAGNGYAVIRFLPPVAGESVPFVRIWSHAFQGPGGWYIENSLTTMGMDVKDPCGEANQALWNSGLESDKEIVRKARKRKLNYFSNIYVVRDPANPENEGKVFIYKYGKKIFDKLNDLMNPVSDDPSEVITPINPFDLWEGANLKIKIRKVEGYPNYDKSEFDKPGPLADDEKMEEIWKSQYPLQELLDPKHFKSYDDLKKRLDKALGQPSAPREQREDAADAPAPRKAAEARQPSAEPRKLDEDEDDDFAFFKNLAEDD